MNSCAFFVNSTTNTISVFPITIIKPFGFRNRCFLKQSSVSANLSISNNKMSSVHYDSLRVLEWDSLCDAVASKPQKYLFDPLLSLRSQCSVNIALFDSFSLCLRLFPVLGPAVVSESDIRREPEASGGDQCGRGNAQARWLQLGLQLHRCSSC